MHGQVLRATDPLGLTDDGTGNPGNRPDDSKPAPAAPTYEYNEQRARRHSEGTEGAPNSGKPDDPKAPQPGLGDLAVSAGVGVAASGVILYCVGGGCAVSGGLAYAVSAGMSMPASTERDDLRMEPAECVGVIPVAPRFAPKQLRVSASKLDSKEMGKKLQNLIDRIHKEKGVGIAARENTTTLNVHKSGHVSLTGTTKPNPAMREVAKEAGITDVPVHGKNLRTPGPKGKHGEARGKKHGDNIGDPVVKQWSSSGAKHAGKACPDCAALQQGSGIKNGTGVQEQKKKPN